MKSLKDTESIGIYSSPVSFFDYKYGYKIFVLVLAGVLISKLFITV